MTPETIVLIISIVLVTFFVGTVLYVKLPKRLSRKKYTQKWKDIQKHCANKDEWSHAVVEADLLLDKVLKKKKVKGKSTGERLVTIQKKFTDNDSVWFAHRLKKKIESSETPYKPKKAEVLKALSGVRQALRDLGAMK